MSKRKTIALQVTPEGLIVRAPMSVSKKKIDEFVARHGEWIERQTAKRCREAALAAASPLSSDDIDRLTDEARRVIPERVAYFAPIVGVTPRRVSVRRQTTRWGSASSKGNLNFNCLLMLAPSEVVDSVVVHELCHLKHMDHSDAFYEEVLRVMPDYRERDGWLRENGKIIMLRAASAKEKS